MSVPSRRAFLATSSIALAGSYLGAARLVHALPARSRVPVAAFLPDLMDPATLRMLALAGVEAARGAGAAYADIRIAEVHWLRTQLSSLAPTESWMTYEYAFGLRVRVDGAWAFAFGTDPTPDGLAHMARTAVATARGVARVAGPTPEMVPAPVVRGEWATPVTIDPFAVSPDAHAEVLHAYSEAGKRVPGGGIGRVECTWSRETRVFASTDGSLLTQRMARTVPSMEAFAEKPVRIGVRLPIAELFPMSAGFEVLTGPAVQESLKAHVEEAVRLLRFPVTDVEVGRYEAVIDGTSLGCVLGGTLAPALELDRVLGYEADGVGTSFLAPVDAVLGQPLFSPVLTVTSDRTFPHYGAAQWDDEGVATESFPVIHQGQVVDYFATRTSAAVLAAWYAKTGKPLKSHGSAVSWTATTSPVGSPAHLTIAAGAAGTTLDALIGHMTNGLLVRGISYIDADQQLLSGSTSGMLFEVRRGQITRRVRGGRLLCRTREFWKALTRVGDASTCQHFVRASQRGETWANTIVPIVAPAAHLRQLDVTRMTRTS